jgi:hypothetical protein
MPFKWMSMIRHLWKEKIGLVRRKLQSRGWPFGKYRRWW